MALLIAFVLAGCLSADNPKKIILPHEAQDFAVSRDSRQAVVSHSLEGRYLQLIGIDLVTKEATVLSENPGFHVHSPAFSSDGRFLAWITTEFRGQGDSVDVSSSLVLHDLKEKTNRTLTAAPNYMYGPAFDPATENIFLVRASAYSVHRERPLDADVFRVSILTGDLVQVTATGWFLGPVSSPPNGTALLITAQPTRDFMGPWTTFWLDPLSGRVTQALPRGPFGELKTATSTPYAQISYDGNSIVVTAEADQTEEFALETVIWTVATGEHHIVENQGNPYMPTLSADGRFMYYLGACPGNQCLWRDNLASSQVEKVFPND